MGRSNNQGQKVFFFGFTLAWLAIRPAPQKPSSSTDLDRYWSKRMFSSAKRSSSCLVSSSRPWSSSWTWLLPFMIVRVVSVNAIQASTPMNGWARNTILCIQKRNNEMSRIAHLFAVFELIMRILNIRIPVRTSASNHVPQPRRRPDLWAVGHTRALIGSNKFLKSLRFRISYFKTDIDQRACKLFVRSYRAPPNRPGIATQKLHRTKHLTAALFPQNFSTEYPSQHASRWWFFPCMAAVQVNSLPHHGICTSCWDVRLLTACSFVSIRCFSRDPPEVC